MSTAAHKTVFSASPTGAAIAIPRSQPVRDALTMTWRNLLNTRRTPQLLIAAAVQPVILVLLFRYIFGGAINVAGVPYVDYLMPGIFAATVVLGAITTGVGLAEDLPAGWSTVSAPYPWHARRCSQAAPSPTSCAPSSL